MTKDKPSTYKISSAEVNIVNSHDIYTAYSYAVVNNYG